jgi:hypothetical protein
MAAVVEESGSVPSFSVAVGGREASREGAVEERMWDMGMMRETGREAGRLAVEGKG